MTTSSDLNALVIDAGVGYALCANEIYSSSLRVDFASRATKNVRLFAPSLWRFELASILTKAVHFREMSEGSARQLLELVGKLPVQLIVPDEELMRQAFNWTLRLKRAAAYDSFYIALAERLGCELWTTDRKLANALNKVSWVHYVGPTKNGESLS
jgi:predicted nucleic acid-binding protein